MGPSASLPAQSVPTYRGRMPSETVTARFCAAMLDAARSDLPPGPSRAARRTLLNVIGTAVSASGSDAVGVLMSEDAGFAPTGEVAGGGLGGRRGAGLPRGVLPGRG